MRNYSSSFHPTHVKFNQTLTLTSIRSKFGLTTTIFYVRCFPLSQFYEKNFELVVHEYKPLQSFFRSAEPTLRIELILFCCLCELILTGQGTNKHFIFLHYHQIKKIVIEGRPLRQTYTIIIKTNFNHYIYMNASKLLETLLLLCWGGSVFFDKVNTSLIFIPNQWNKLIIKGKTGSTNQETTKSQ